jgi:GNAT superfamily N-acetyltransferase
MAPFHTGALGRPPRRGRELVEYGVGVLRQEGPGALLRESLARVLYRRYHLMELRLGPLPSTERSAPLEIEELPPSRSEEHRAFWSHLSPGYFEWCFAAGYRCYIAQIEGEPLGVSWVAHDRIWSDFLECQIPLADDEAYFFGTFALPAARGRGIASALLLHAARTLAESGHRRVFDLHLPGNRPAARMFDKVGFRRVAVVGHYRLGRRRWLFCRARRGFEPPGVERA